MAKITQALLEDKLQQYIGQENTAATRAAVVNAVQTALLPENSGLSFGQALTALQAGQKVARAGWNGRNMHLYFLPGQFILIDDGKPTAPSGDPKADALLSSVQLEPCICMLTAQGKHQPGWLASQNDMLAFDWLIVP